MGVDFDALLFYGMPIDSKRGWDLVEELNGANGPLEVMDLNPMMESSDMLFVRESYHSGDENEDEVLVKLSDVMGKESEWRQLIVDACITHGLTFVEPGWYFATRFS